VGVDRGAALRMIRLSGQQGVPVITIDDQVVVGFNRRRLEELLAQGTTAEVELGAAVADAAARVQTNGAYVGHVKRGSLAEKAGLKAKDVIVELNGQAVRNSADLARIMAGLHPPARPKLVYMRQGQRVEAELSL
jgi:S1-C subfamily serine protease